MSEHINQNLVNELRERSLAIVSQHEAEDHEGAPCVGNRTSLVAWLCHVLGVRDYARLAELVAEYDTVHVAHVAAAAPAIAGGLEAEPVLTRTDAEVAARVKKLGEGDLLGFERSDLISFLSFDAAQEFLKDGITREEFENGRPTKATREAAIAEIADYIDFAVEKATNHRGISANRSISHFRAYVWIAGDEDFARIDWNKYAQYGAPILSQIIELYDLRDEVATTEGFRRMAQGLPCEDGCREGCGNA
jgi:hypothetical protein